MELKVSRMIAMGRAALLLHVLELKHHCYRHLKPTEVTVLLLWVGGLVCASQVVLLVQAESVC